MADLHPTGADLQRYLGYLGGHVNTHLRFGADAPAGPSDKGVYSAFKDIRLYWQKERRHYRHTPKYLTYPLLQSLLATEKIILGASGEWTNYRNGKPQGRPERLERRVQSGKSSFLYFYGRDANPTGFTEFDELYADMWSHAREAQNDPDHHPSLAKELASHHDAVLDAEITVSGKMMLAQK